MTEMILSQTNILDRQGPSDVSTFHIKTDKSFYHAGETISGQIYLETNQPYPGTSLYIELEGKEATHVRDPTPCTLCFCRQKKPVVHVNERIILHEKQSIETWNTLETGQYVIPFAIKLPQTLPASFYEEWDFYSCYVKYKIRASVQCDKVVKPGALSELVLVIRDRPVITAVESISREMQVPITANCCCPQGSVILRATFEKNVVRPGESVRVVVEVDNSLSQREFTSLRVFIQQRWEFLKGKQIGDSASALQYNEEYEYLNLRPGQTSQVATFNFKIPNFRGDKHNLDERSNGLPKGTKGIGTTTNSELINVQYFLVLKSVISDIDVTSDFPWIKIPLQILYPDPDVDPIVLPDGWNPQILPIVNIDLAAKQLLKQVKRTKCGIVVKNEMVQHQMP